jgi:hypothetical protein
MQKSESNRDILKVTQSSPYLWTSFHPQTSLSMVSAKKEKFIKSGSFNAQRLRVMIVAVQGRSSENICSSSGGPQEKGKTG